MKRSQQDSLFEEAYEVIKVLEAHGYEAYLVGGCVRDALLDRPVHDVDIATSADPARVASLFERVIPTGLQHGTVTVVRHGYTFEVTTFRSEAGYSDYRRPSEVHYIQDLTEDLRRRDYTMNAIAMDRYGQLHDPFHGAVDLEQGWIRAVGQAEERYAEDALRMLRGIRFASVLRMRLAKSVWRGIMAKKTLLRHIAMERVRDELWKLTAGPDPAKGWSMLVRSGVLRHTKEPLRIYGREDGPAWLPVYGALGRVDTPEQRLAAVAIGLGATAEAAAQDAKALRLSKAEQDAIVGVLSAFARLEAAAHAYRPAVSSGRAAQGELAPMRLAVAQAVLAHGENAVRGALACSRALAEAAAPCAAKREARADMRAALGQDVSVLPSYQHEGMHGLYEHVSAWIDAMPAKSLAQLKLSGKDLLAVTTRQGGPWVRACLEHVWLKTAEGLLLNEAELLLQEAEQWLRAHPGA